MPPTPVLAHDRPLIGDPSLVDGEAVARALHTDLEGGLGTGDAAARLARDESNELRAVVQIPTWRRILGQFQYPLIQPAAGCPGDRAGGLLELGEGDLVGADARLVRAAALRVQEASLTGESEVVLKDVATLAASARLATG